MMVKQVLHHASQRFLIRVMATITLSVSVALAPTLQASVSMINLSTVGG